MIIKIQISDDIIQKAEKKAIELGELENSIEKGEGNVIGFIGEEIINNYINGIMHNTYDYDIIKNGKKIEVKAKKTSVAPLKDYQCSVSNFNTKQKCDYYAFARITNDYKIGYICGFISKERFFKEAIFMKKGDIEGSNNFIVVQDCYNVPISTLSPISDIIRLLN